LLKQIAEIAKIVKLRHFRKAITSPNQALRALKYHYRRVSQKSFVEFLARKYGCSYYDIEAAYKDLSQNSTLWEDIQNKLLIYPDGYGLQMTRELPCLYLITRLTKPNWIIETGVSSGASSAYLLRALDDNKKGKLVGIYILGIPKISWTLFSVILEKSTASYTTVFILMST
jgi:hypothetical protein